MIKLNAARVALLITLAWTGGCATSGGQVGNPPEVRRPTEAGTLLLYRDGSLVGFFATMLIKIENKAVYRLGRKESYSISLDPGEYLLDYSIGLNECGRIVSIKSAEILRLRLAPDCMIYED